MSPRRAPLLAGVLATLTIVLPAQAQELAGTAVDSAGRPLPSVPVALHRVGGGSGASVAAASTDRDGRFRFVIERPDSALYFVAMRHGERMYIGPPVRGGAERVMDYVVRAEAGNEVGAVASALGGRGAAPRTLAPPGPPAASGEGAVWLLVVLALVVAAVFVTTAPAYRRRRGREMVMELARIENRLAAAAPGSDTTADQRRRESLRERLTPRA